MPGDPVRELTVPETITHIGKVWRWSPAEGKGSWHFLAIDGEAAQAIATHAAIRRMELGTGRGFGSVKVTALIGASRWSTSVFPSSATEGFLLPLKAAIRAAEGIGEGDEIAVELEFL